MKEKKVTIQDVADLVGVSKTTVSKYLNGQYQFMSKNTAAKIAEAIQVLGFRPSMAARSLKSDRSHLIGVVMPHVWSNAIAQSIQNVCSECEKSNYFAIICSAKDSIEHETECINRLIDQRVDGILCYTGALNKRYREINIPVVVTNRYQEDCGFDMVVIESYNIVKQALAQLLERGYESVAFFTTHTTPLSAKINREKGFYDFVREHGLSVDRFPRYCVDTGSVQDFSEQLHDFCRKNKGRKKAVFAASNSVMLRVMTAMNNSRDTIPQDLGLCGFDLSGGHLDRYTPGSLIIQHPLKQMANQAFHLLMLRIDGDKTDMPMTIKIEPRLTQIPK